MGQGSLSTRGVSQQQCALWGVRLRGLCLTEWFLGEDVYKVSGEAQMHGVWAHVGWRRHRPF